ncbi:MAG: hypothetical protein CL883_02185 [Dehalococcoidia bacterium]|nr:hypothetical protein [Dehalococcoidia bacterium]|tara:strand:+ start:43 stop:345 length:303 start_codon:yes stop_codon:yes gene_type:complete
MTLEKQKVQECSICKEDIDVQDFGNGKTWEFGHNAEPVNDGRCCTKCNWDVVIQERLRQHGYSEEQIKAEPTFEEYTRDILPRIIKHMDSRKYWGIRGSN